MVQLQGEDGVLTHMRCVQHASSGTFISFAAGKALVRPDCQIGQFAKPAPG